MLPTFSQARRARLSSGQRWPPTASVIVLPRSRPQTIVTGAIRGRWRSAR